MRKNSRKFIIILTAFLLVFSNLGGLVGHAASEEVNQSISIHVDKSEAGPGEDVLVSVSAAGLENVSGIAVNYQLPEGKFTKIATKFNPATGNFEANIPVRDYSVAGLWNAVGINIYYENGDPAEVLDYERDLSGGNFTVINENTSVQDTTNPIFNSVSVDKTAAYPGDVVKVSVDAGDDLSGVSHVEVYYSGYSSKAALAYYNEQTQKYEANISIQEFERAGDRALNVINIYDYAGNNYELSYDEVLTAGDFQVINENEDVTAPTVHGVSVDKTEASAGDSVTWSFDIRDDKSGVAYVSVTYENPADPYNRQYGNAVYNENTNMYELKVPITEETMLGDWRIRYINVSDNANNGGNSIRNSAINGSWEFDFSPGNFKVVEKSQEVIDGTPPVINGMSVNKTEAQYGDEVIFSVDVSDDISGVKEVYVQYWNDHYGNSYSYATYNEETKKYEIKFPIDYTTATGQWRVTYISVGDNQDNFASFYEGGEVDFTNSQFTVLTENMDQEPPTFNGVSIDKNEAHPGDTVTVSVDAIDTKAGINEVYVTFDGPGGYFWEVAEYNSETQKYEVPFVVNDQTSPGKWSISSIYMNDYAGNNVWLNNGEHYNLDFTVMNDNIDVTAPVVNSVSVDKTNAVFGDSVKVSLDVTDAQSGVDYVNVYLVSSTGGNLYESAQFNPETNLYEVIIPITETFKSGQWNIYYVDVRDNAYNDATFYNGENADFSAADFNVVNENADITPPVVHSVSVDKTEAQPGDTVTVSIEATDDKSGIEAIHVHYWSNYGGMADPAVYNPETDRYEMTMTIDDETPPGEYSISGIYIQDNEYNGTWFNNGEYDLSNGNFTVINDKIDLAPPQVVGVSVDKTEANPGDTVTVSIDAMDDKSGIHSIFVDYYVGNDYVEQEAVLNSDTGKYELELVITDKARPGVWTIHSIYLEDKKYNSVRYYYDEEGIDFSGGNITVFNENADMTPPTVTGISVDKTEAKPGDIVTLSIEAADDKSDISYLEVRYYNDYYGSMYQEAVYNSETNKYEISIPISDETKPGQWNLERIYIEDSLGNYDYIYSFEDVDLSSGDYTVINDNIDITAPVVNSVSVDKTEAVFGDSVKVSLDVTDAQSGVENVNVYFTSTTGGSMYETAQFNPETNLYEVNLPITETFKPGQWSIYYVEVLDKEYNGEYYYNGENADFSAADFNVENENADITPPVVHSVSVDKTDVQPGDTVTVSLDVTDDKSGVEYVSVYYYDQTGREIYNYAVYNEETQRYEATITIDEETYPGKWELTNIMVQDREYNHVNYLNGDGVDFSNGHFTVINDKIDAMAPEVTGVSVDATEAHPGDTVTVSIDAVDDKSGIQTVSVQYRAGYRYLEEQEAVYNSETGKYEVKIPITDDARPGLWSISSIRVVDNNYNSNYIDNGYDQDLSGGDFTVFNENADITPPTVQSVSVDKKEAVPGDAVTLSIDAVDDKSEVSYIQVRYNNQYGGYYYQNPEWNTETNKFEMSIPITMETKGGLWSLDHIYIEDSEGNYNYIYSYEMDDLGDANYSVINDSIEVTPPSVNSVSVDKSEARPGDTVKVSVDVTDESGVSAVFVNLNGEYGSWGTSAEYNPETNLYEVFVPITDDFRPGVWGIGYVEVHDNYENEKYYYNGEDADFSAANFTVINENVDVAPPTIQSVSVDKKEANLGDQVTVSIDARDDKSGVQDIGVYLENYNYGSMYLEATYNEATGKYEAKLDITDSIRSGNWGIWGIYVSDHNYNGIYYYDGVDGNDFSNADFTVTNANDDVTPPTLNGVSVDKQEVQAGENVTITFDAEDDQSDIGYISVDYRLPNNSSKNATAYYNYETDKYEAVLEVGSFAKAGIWKISSIYLSDNYGNSTYIYNSNLGVYPDSEGMDLSGGDFAVINDNEDLTAPEVTSIKVNKDQFEPGETAVVELDVTDSQSGVNSISLAYTGSNGGYLYADATYNESTQKYQAEFQINELDKPGVWSVSHIYVTDNEGNYQYLDNREYDFSIADFTVINDQADITPPSINSISVDKQEVSIGEEITISFDVKDSQSTVDEVWTVISNMENDPWRFVEPVFEYAVYNEETQKYEVKIPVTEATKPGTWMVEYVSVSDTEQNWQSFNLDTNKDLLSTSKFTVINDQADSKVPTFNGVTVDKKVVNVGEEITFSVEATDESGIKEVFIAFDGMDDAHAEAVYNEETKKYDVTIPITKDYKPGTWKVRYITIYDHAMNGIVVDGEEVDLSSVDFEIINDEYDNGFEDTINSISIDKNVAKPGEKVKVSIQFKDNSNIKYVDVRYVGGNGNDFVRSAFYNSKTGNYEVEISISPLFKPTLWSLESIYVETNDDAYLNLFERDNEFDVGDFRVSNSGLDTAAPAAPVVNPVTDQSETITGTTEAKVRVIAKAGDQELGTAVSDYEGNFSIAIKALPAGTQLTVTAIDSSDNESEATTVTVQDLTPPEAPVVNGVGDQSTEVTGTTEAGATVTVTIGTESYTGTADQTGYFTVTIPVQKAGTVITVTAADAAGNASGEGKVTVEDKTAPEAPTVDEVSDKTTVVTGNAEIGSTVTVTIGTANYNGTTDSSGVYKVTIPVQAAGTTLSITATDEAGNISLEKTVTVVDKTAPSAPRVNYVSDKATTVTGTTEANADVTVTIGTETYTGTADSEGTFSVSIPVQIAGTRVSVSATDEAGNTSSVKTVIVLDKTAPSVPKVNYVSDKATVVTGETEGGAYITVTIGTETYTGRAYSNGTFKISIPLQTAGTRISVRAADAAGNKSSLRTVTVVDKTAPSIPKVNYVTDKATYITGTAEAGAYITVTIGTETYTGRAYSNGSFKVTIPVQTAGTRISVRAKDAAGNNSNLRTVTVLDKTAPSVPTVDPVTVNTTNVTGLTEGGAYIIVTIGSETYTGRAYSNGSFKVTIPAQKAGTRIYVRAKDAAGNASGLKSITVVE